MGRNIRQLIFDFHTNQDTISDGKELLISSNMVNMVIAVTGNATDFELIPEVKSNDTDTYTAVGVINVDTYDLSSMITANGKYKMELEGYTKCRIRLRKLGTGVLSVRGTITD